MNSSAFSKKFFNGLGLALSLLMRSTKIGVKVEFDLGKLGVVVLMWWPSPVLLLALVLCSSMASGERANGSKSITGI